jgi:hypothetical protein
MSESPRIRSVPLRANLREGLDGLASLQADWMRLAGGSTHYFHDYYWFLDWVRHDPELPIGLHFCVIEDGAGEVIGIVPLQARVERIRRLPFRVWTLVGATGHDVMLFASGADFLCRSDADAAQVLEAATRFLGGVRPGRALLQLGRMTSDSRVLSASTGLPGRFAYIRGATSRIDTDRTVRELESSLSRKTRANLRGFSNRASAIGGLEFRLDEPGTTGFEAAYEDFKRVEASGWKAHARSGGALTTNREDNQRRFVEAMFHARESQCKPLIFRIAVSGNCIAGLIALRYGRTLVAMKIGCLDAERRLGAGHLLLREVLRYSCDQAEIEWVDMVSDASWLAPWKPEMRPHHWVYLPLGALGRIAIGLMRIRRASNPRDHHILETRKPPGLTSL